MIFMTNITVYVTNNCGACHWTLKWMYEHDIEPTEVINVHEEPNQLDILREHGFMQFPVVTINGFDNAWTGVNVERLEELL